MSPRPFEGEGPPLNENGTESVVAEIRDLLKQSFKLETIDQLANDTGETAMLKIRTEEFLRALEEPSSFGKLVVEKRSTGLPVIMLRQGEKRLALITPEGSSSVKQSLAKIETALSMLTALRFAEASPDTQQTFEYHQSN